MIYSMTAFALRDVHGDSGEISWELRSVNHRYLELSVRLPDELRPLESAVRERIRDGISRGKVECTLRYKPPSEQVAPQVDLEMASQLIQAVQQVSALIPGGGEVNILEILKWPGVITSSAPSMEHVGPIILDTLDQSIAALIAARAGEGEKLATLIQTRCTEVAGIVTQVRSYLPGILAAQRARLLARLVEIQESMDQSRLEQEMAFLAQKTDVAEELDRLEAHLAEARRLTGGETSKAGAGKNPVGRRLDFLMQEMHREANTLSAKSVDKDMTAASVDLRVLIEQMREQVQNIE